MNITIEAVKKEEEEILMNLREKFHCEHSQYDERDVNDAGLFCCGNLGNYWMDENEYLFFIKTDGKLAGFMIISDYYNTDDEKINTLSELFIMPKYRRKKIGRYAVESILEKYKGKWQISFHRRNEVSRKFWIKTIDEYLNGKYKMIKIHPELVNMDEKMGDGLVFET